MHPILTVLQLGDRQLPIGSYGVLLCLAIAAAALGTLRTAARARLDVGACIAALGIAVAAGFAGAALLHAVVQCVRLGSLAPLLWPPGLSFFGAALGGASALALAGPALGVPVLALADRAVPALCLGHAIGRIGCFLGGCCFGQPWHGPLAMRPTHPLAPAAALDSPLHPLPLYEAFGLVVLAVAFASQRVRAPGSGQRVLAYAAAYSALRLTLESLRGDEVRGVFFGGAFSTAQLIAACVLAACAVCWLRRPPGDGAKSRGHALLTRRTAERR
jgi:phosphatidylglycerol:prolipoprotein diacylglycerol transferase